LGRPTAALTELGLVLRDAGTDKELRARAEREKRSAEQAVTRVTFRLTDPARERVELDGEPAPLAPGAELTVDPGTHQVRVLSGASIVFDQELELSPGERVELRVGERSRRIDVVIVPDPQHPAPTGTKPRPQPVAPARAAGISPVWFYAGAGATLALTGLTIWSGLDTNAAYADYKRELPRLKQPEADDQVRAGHALELRTNLLLGGSLLCAAGTAVLGIGFVDWRGARARVGLTPTSVGVSGEF
jgi:hypothetical protein